MKKLSIIIPVYNTEKHLKKCFDSIVNQNNSEIEVIVVNDGSTDDSEVIIKEYTNKYKDVFTYYKKGNTGVADTRNFGIKKATGEYIMFLDSDDYIDKKLYDNIKKYIDEDIELIKYKMQRVEDRKSVV